MKFNTFGEISNNQHQNPSNNETIQILEETLQVLRTKYQNLENKAQKIDQTHNIKKDQSSSPLKKDINKLKNSQKWKENVEKAIFEESELIQRTISQTIQKNSKLSSEIAQLKEDNIVLCSKLDIHLEKNRFAITQSIDTAEVHKQIEQEIDILSQQSSNIHSEVLTLQQTENEKQKQLDDLVQSNLSKKENNIKLKSLKNELNTELNNEKQTGESFQTQIHENRQTVLNLEKLNCSKKEKFSNIACEINFLKAKIEEEVSCEESFKQTFENLCEDQQKLQQTIELRTKEEGNLIGDIEELRCKIQSLETENEMIIQQLSRITKIH